MPEIKPIVAMLSRTRADLLAALFALAACLGELAAGRPASAPDYSWPLALARNLALYPVILGHGFRRLVPL